MKIITLSEPLLVAAALLLVSGLLVLQLRTRRLNVRIMWLVLAVLAGLTALVLSLNPPDGSSWLWLLLAGGLGGLVGTTRGQLTDIRDADPDAGALLVQSTRIGVLLWSAALVARVVLRQVVGRSNPDGATVSLTTASLLVFAVADLLANTIAIHRAVQHVRRITA
ncbi:MAG TPA: hypothetical protein VGJ60_22235 [Chloroflexota bacterium]|jgi:hypothetical protein